MTAGAFDVDGWEDALEAAAAAWGRQVRGAVLGAAEDLPDASYAGLTRPT